MRDPFQFQEEEIVRDEFTRDSAHRALHAAVRELDEMRWRRNQSISESDRLREPHDELVERVDYLQRVCGEIDSHPEARRNPSGFRMCFPRRVRTSRGVRMHGTMTGRFSSRDPLRSVADLRARAVELEREREARVHYEEVRRYYEEVRRYQDVRIELPNYAEMGRRLAGIFGETKKKEPEPELRGLWPAKSPLIKKAANA